MLILGIETSCDETAAALYDKEQGLIKHVVHSQIDLHRLYGGVVPELASRDHIQKIIPMIKSVFDGTNFTLKDLDAIAFTQGPGLIGALMVGAGVAQSMAMALNIPSVGVHHMEGHLLAPMLEDKQPEFPFVALLVSGGHTQLYAVKDFGQYEILGDTLDDAAGEAFDKTAKLIGLPYPGGPEISKLAESGDASVYNFPKPMTNRPGLDFSFAGLKTFARNTWHDSDQSEQTRANIAASFQEAATETLKIKCRRALEATGYQSLVIAGGVSANSLLREKLHTLNAELFYPRLDLCTDNAAMIAYAGLKRFERGFTSGLKIDVFARGEI